MTTKKVRSDKKFKFTKAELRQQIESALMWASDGTEVRVGDEKPTPFIMGDIESLTTILTLALVEGLPAEEDSSASATA